MLSGTLKGRASEATPWSSPLRAPLRSLQAETVAPRGGMPVRRPPAEGENWGPLVDRSGDSTPAPEMHDFGRMDAPLLLTQPSWRTASGSATPFNPNVFNPGRRLLDQSKGVRRRCNRRERIPGRGSPAHGYLTESGAARARREGLARKPGVIATRRSGCARLGDSIGPNPATLNVLRRGGSRAPCRGRQPGSVAAARRGNGRVHVYSHARTQGPASAETGTTVDAAARDSRMMWKR